MVREPYRLEVRGGPAVTGVFEYTRHNGVLSPVVERRGADAYAVSFSQMADVGLEHAELYNMARAKSAAQLKVALAPMRLYTANLLVGGRDGTLLYIRPGKIPKRPAGVDLTRPVDGNTSRTAWTGFTNFE